MDKSFVNRDPERVYLRKICRLRTVLAGIGTLAISMIGFIGWKMPYSSPTDVLLTLMLGGCDGFGAPQYLCSYHMNTAFSYLLFLLQRMTGAFNIYGYTLIGLFTLSFLLLQREASDRNPVFHLVAAVMQILCLFHFTYTVVAYVSMGAGMLCRASIERRSRMEKGTGGERRSPEVFCCWLLMLSGASLRRDVVLSTIALLLPTLFSNLFAGVSKEGSREETAGKENHFRRAAVSRLPVMFAAALVLWGTASMVIVPLMYKSSGSEWQNYYVHNIQSLRIRDGQAIDYGEYKEVMEEIGWSENDLSMAESWLFSDLDVFSAENMKKTADAIRLTEKWNLDPADLLRKFFGTPMAAGFLAVCCLATAFALRCTAVLKRSGVLPAAVLRGRMLVLLSAALLPCLLWGALYVRQRFVDRVAVPLLVLGILQFTELFEQYYCHCGQNTEKQSGHADRSAAAVIAIALLFCIVAAGKINREAGEPLSSQEILTFRQYLEEHSDIVFLTTSNVLNRMNRDVPAASVSAEAEYGNTVRLGSQLSFSGSYYERCRRLGIPDPDHLFKNLIIKEPFSGEQRIMLIASRKAEVVKIRTFLEEHYGYTGEYTELAEILPGVIVYSFR